MNPTSFGTTAWIVVGIALGVMLSTAWNHPTSPPSAVLHAQPSPVKQERDADDLRGDAERLKEKATDQAHVTVSVSCHWSRS